MTIKRVLKDRKRREELSQSFKEIELLNEKALAKREEVNRLESGEKDTIVKDCGPKKFHVIVKGIISI